MSTSIIVNSSVECAIYLNELLTVTLGTLVTTLYTYSAEDQVFYVERQIAMVSGTIKAMLMGQFAESKGEIRFPEITSQILEKVIQYFHFKNKYMNSTAKIPEFKIEPEIALELLMAANYLDA